jgi:broad specificity phosphatase PhoE
LRRLLLVRHAPASATRVVAFPVDEAAGLRARLDVAPAECDFDRWAGLKLADVDVGAWMLDADAAPHGGETLRVFAARVAAWVDDEAERDGAAVAITELHGHEGRWTVTRLNHAVAA